MTLEDLSGLPPNSKESPSVPTTAGSTGGTAAVWWLDSLTTITSSSARLSSSGTLCRSFPETFSIPKRFAKHMMIVADLENGNADAIEDAVVGAWELQGGT